MSYAGMSTMTGFNDDAMSVVSNATNFVELVRVLAPYLAHFLTNEG